jgi:hypothetical protein
MFSEVFFLAILHVATALAAEEAPAPATHHYEKRGLATGVKVALGLCIPIAALTIILGCITFMYYPAQRAKLRRENPGMRIGLREVMDGGVRSKPPRTSNATLPPYTERQGSAKAPSVESSTTPVAPANTRVDGTNAV